MTVGPAGAGGGGGGAYMGAAITGATMGAAITGATGATAMGAMGAAYILSNKNIDGPQASSGLNYASVKFSF